MTMGWLIRGVAGFCLLMGLACGGGAGSSGSADAALIRTRMEEQGRSEHLSSASTVGTWLATQNADGSWPDIDYTNQDSASWLPITHVSRLAGMASAYCTTGHTYCKSASLALAFSKALDYWTQAKLVCPNWWYNDIGVPLNLGPALLLMQAELSSAQVSAGAALLPVAAKITGENLVWYCFGATHRALLEGNSAHFEAAVMALKGTLVLTTAEGIQVDGTFYQHGNQLYNGGYGYSYVSDLSKWVSLLSGTSLAIEGSQRSVLDHLVLDGTGWMLRYGTLDYSTMGRGISRKGQIFKTETLASLDRLIAAGSTRLAELQSLRNHVAGASTGTTGHKHFWRGDYTTHREAGSLVTLRLFSTRSVGPECGNEENLLGYYQAMGTTLIYRDGMEYADIFPAWDWLRLPGTTLEELSAVPTFSGDLTGSQGFVGGVSDGVAGLSAFDQADAKSTVKAHKSWFFFGNGFLALGAGISSSGTGSVNTTLNQCLLQGAVRASSGGSVSTRAAGEVNLSSTRWVLHDGVGYVFPTATQVHLKNTAQTGDWNLINAMYASASLSCDIFRLSLDHGVAPTGASYAYAVLPDTDETTLAGFADSSPLSILANTSTLQAARHSGLGLSGVAFFSAGSVTLKSGLTLSTDTPILVLVRETSTGLELSVAEPTQTASTALLTLSGKYSGSGTTWNQAGTSTSLSLSLPSAEWAGSTLTFTLTK